MLHFHWPYKDKLAASLSVSYRSPANEVNSDGQPCWSFLLQFETVILRLVCAPLSVFSPPLEIHLLIGLYKLYQIHLFQEYFYYWSYLLQLVAHVEKISWAALSELLDPLQLVKKKQNFWELKIYMQCGRHFHRFNITNQEHRRNDLVASFSDTMRVLLQEQQIEGQLQQQPLQQ